MRRYMDEQGFREIETPMIKSPTEGAATTSFPHAFNQESFLRCLNHPSCLNRSA